MVKLDMLATLDDVKLVLPALLLDENGWNGLFVDYEHPFVERLWRTWGEYRINLHRIHPCKPGQPLWHPHPWPSAMELYGPYEMAVGFGSGEEPPLQAARIMLVAGSRYEMVEPDGWHSVRPLDRPIFSLMVTGKPWTRSSPRSEKPLRALLPHERSQLFTFFRSTFPVSNPAE